MEYQAILRIITTPIGASIILTIITVIIFCISCDSLSLKAVIKFAFLCAIASFALISFNNYYLFSDFEKEPIIRGSLMDYARSGIGT